jgi:crooked neck
MSGRNSGQVKNRAPSAIQISAEQILREASERRDQTRPDIGVAPILNKINDAEEYQSQMRSRRKTFENEIRRQREHIGTWVKYAKFEEENREMERARSIYERALEVDHKGPLLWLRYAEFEMRNEFVNHARNVFDRAVAILPRVDQLWYKYTYMEEMVGDVSKARGVWERWMEWMPDDNAWLAYARFEVRCGTLQLAKAVLERYAAMYPSVRSYLKYARWAEFDAKDVTLARSVFERCLGELERDEINAKVFRGFAAFEERHGEYERARIIYMHAVNLFNLGKAQSELAPKSAAAADDEDDVQQSEKQQRAELYKQYVSFEKKHGDKDGVENLILTKQRAEYKDKTGQDGYDYDSWLEWAKLEATHGNVDDVRDVYERAVANVPPVQEKTYWTRYIYLWINYSLFEELDAEDADRASEVLAACISVIPHKQFSFAKIWVLAAKNHIRRKDLKSARAVMGKAIGMCGKESIFTEYISFERALGEVDRCRALYSKYLETYPENCNAWKKYAELESSVGEVDRARALLELAVGQEELDMPEVLWKSFIDFEISQGEGANARSLYNRLLEKTGHVKVWISYAQFEASEVGEGIDAGREIFSKAYDILKEDDLKEERVLLLDAWRALEKEKGTPEKVAEIETKMPRRIKKKRMRTDPATGAELGWEEYYDYAFPDDKKAGSNLKILEMAAKWKAKQAAAAKRKREEEEEAE